VSQRYVTTDTVLDKILANTARELAARQQARPLTAVRAGAEQADSPRDMLAALRPDDQQHVSLLAEVKHASPSRGVLIEPFEPVALGQTYAANGAAAISVLTDEQFFQGSLDDLTAVRDAVSIPVLRKDFIIDPYQVYEGRAAGADAILLIVAALADGQLADLHALITGLGMAALVEVHNAVELDRALKISPALLGINNRNLKTFEVTLETTARLAARVPAGITLVAESGIFTGADVTRMGGMGAHAVLVGESLVTAQDTGALVRELSGQPLQKR
jgi:indole-3-glycerol phosphate synthase